MLTIVGVRIATCTTPGTIALTFDDGPFQYTSELLDLLATYSIKATFFLNGNNFANAANAPYPDIIRRMVADGHQVASHGYAHQNLDNLSSTGRRAEMGNLEQLLVNVIGKFPTYMRPPYGACGAACQTDMAALGYHVIIWDIDTLDYANQANIQVSKDIFDGAVSTSASSNRYISLAHDVHPQTVRSLAEHIILTTLSRGYQAVTVGECLGDPAANWYRTPETGSGTTTVTPSATPTTTTPSSTSVAPSATPSSPGGGLVQTTNARCGVISGVGYTCLGSAAGNCCSQWGWW